MYAPDTESVCPVLVITGLGVGVTSITVDEVVLPALLYAVNVTVWLPAVGKQILVVLLVALAMLAPAATHFTLSIVPVLVLVKVMQLSWQADVAVDVKDATGAVTVPTVLSERLSIA